MRGVVRDFENLTLTSFPITFEPHEFLNSVLLLLLDKVDLTVDFACSFSVNKMYLLIF